MRSEPCFENKGLEEAAERAEERKRRAIERLTAQLEPQPEPRFGWPMLRRVNGDD